MKTNILCICTLTVSIFFNACTKSEFLAKKPATTIVPPKTLTDYQHLLDNTIYQGTVALAQLSDDDFFVQNEESLAQWSPVEQNTYLWMKNIYTGNGDGIDWKTPYKNIFYSNSVIDGLSKSDSSSSVRGKYLKGWALFNRSYFFYDLTRNFCKAYNSVTADTDLGIPIRLSAGIDKIEQRASLKVTLNQIINDLLIAEVLLPSERPTNNLNRPSKIAVYALLSRIYLDMREYSKAELYAIKCLELYSVLIDYNSVNQTITVPFSITNDELIYNTTIVPGYELTTNYRFSPSRIKNELIKLYEENDLRKPIYFNKNLTDGNYTKKAGYNATNYPFSGLATDEVYLIRAECLARRGETKLAMDKLNELLITRHSNAIPYQPLTANSSADALSMILSERRKELVFRGLRWHDLKRFNMENANISLSRTLRGIQYTLPANDPRWVFPIPNDEIVLSGIQQNRR